jgi:hypothetical protein
MYCNKVVEELPDEWRERGLKPDPAYTPTDSSLELGW